MITRPRAEPKLPAALQALMTLTVGLRLAVAMLLALMATGLQPAGAQQNEPSPVSAVPRAPDDPGEGPAQRIGPSGEVAAWILVDADTGLIVAGNNLHQRLRPASTIKLLTALIALERLPENDEIPTSVRAESMPARKMNMLAGEVWDLEDSLHNMLIVSANDAAVAIAERIGGGSLDGWQIIAEATADALGMVDDPILADPSGLDDEFSNKRGSRISAYDLAIAARAAFARPEIIQIISKRRHEYDNGGDGEPHSLYNSNLLPDLYEGAIGGKTGFTERAGRSLVGIAKRGDRTMIAIAIDAVDTYGTVTALFDRGFNSNAGAETRFGRLPDVVTDASVDDIQVTDDGEVVEVATGVAARGVGSTDGVDPEDVEVAEAAGTAEAAADVEDDESREVASIEFPQDIGVRGRDRGVDDRLSASAVDGGTVDGGTVDGAAVDGEAVDETAGTSWTQRALVLLLTLGVALAVAIGLRRRHVVRRRARARQQRKARRRGVEPPSAHGVADTPERDVEPTAAPGYEGAFDEERGVEVDGDVELDSAPLASSLVGDDEGWGALPVPQMRRPRVGSEPRPSTDGAEARRRRAVRRRKRTLRAGSKRSRRSAESPVAQRSGLDRPFRVGQPPENKAAKSGRPKT